MNRVDHPLRKEEAQLHASVWLHAATKVHTQVQHMLSAEVC